MAKRTNVNVTIETHAKFKRAARLASDKFQWDGKPSHMRIMASALEQIAQLPIKVILDGVENGDLLKRISEYNDNESE